MTRKPDGDLRRGWTTGACATAATKAALLRLWGGAFPDLVSITLPKGETPEFPLAFTEHGADWVSVGITKDAGDDPDVTHGALIIVTVRENTAGIRFKAGEGVGTITKPGLPIPVGEPAINPVPRQMMTQEVEALAAQHNRAPHVDISVSIPDGAEIAKKTWNPRLGITGGLSILGTTGVVRPFSCAAWIASIHRGIDVARADGLPHVAGCTGATSEKTVQDFYGLPDHAMLDMGDFVGGMIKYLRKNPVSRLTVAGGIGKMTKLAQGASDLHSSRSQVDFDVLAKWTGVDAVANANSALDALQIVGPRMGQLIADRAREAGTLLVGHGDQPVMLDVIVVDRAGQIIGRSGP